MHTTELTARAIAWTHFDQPAVAGTGWTVDEDTDPTSGQALAEFAGRACYQSWSKPNPATATNAGYLEHILDVGHLSVLEHGTVTFYLTGVSRSFTHELIRHRHFSYSQLSQRYVPAGRTGVVEPDVIAQDPYLHRVFDDAMAAADAAYAELLHGLERKVAEAAPLMCRICGSQFRAPLTSGEFTVWCGVCEGEKRRTDLITSASTTSLRKQARQAARAVLPNAAETRIVVTGNYRAWRHFITLRASEAADIEIRAAAIACLRELQRIAPNVFADFTVRELPDGTEVADAGHPSI